MTVAIVRPEELLNRRAPKRRVLFVEPAGRLWGSERALLDLMEGVAAAGWEIGVCCPGTGPLLEKLASRDVAVFATLDSELHCRTRWRRLRASLRIAAAIHRFEPDIVHVNQAGATKLSLLASAMQRVPVFSHVRIFEDIEFLSGWAGRSGRLNTIVVISDSVAAASIGRLPMEKLWRLYDPYVRRVDVGGRARRIQRNRFVCASRVVPGKGHAVVLEAVLFLAERGIGARVSILGDSGTEGGYGTELRRRAESLGLDKYLEWKGGIDDVRPSFASAVAVLCPSAREPLGRVVLEAWDAGSIPIAWTGSGGAAEIIAECRGGLLYDEQNGASLADAMRRAMEMNADDRGEMAMRGLEWLSANADPRVAGNALCAKWECAIRGKTK